MALARFEIAVCADSVLPRDRVVNTLHFNIQEIPIVSPSPDLDALCNDLADLYDTTWHSGHHETTVTAYDQEGTKPVYPAARVTKFSGSAPASGCPREVALCLSFYADQNIPRHRGRIYLPLCTSGHTGPSVRPTDAELEQVLTMADGFKDLGGADVDWQVWSVADDTGRNVSTAWCDDEWDTMRSRGMRSTKRVTRAIGE